MSLQTFLFFFDSHEKCEYVTISVRPAGRLYVCDKNFNVAIFLDTIYITNAKLCMIVLLIELYPFIPLSVTLIVIQSHRVSNNFN